MPVRANLLALGLALAGCAGAGAGAVINAAVNTAVAVGASAVSRSQGNCYADCPPGTLCNHQTGLCEALPCRGLCAGGETCDRSGAAERCVPEASTTLSLEPRAPPVLQPARVTPQ